MVQRAQFKTIEVRILMKWLSLDSNIFAYCFLTGTRWNKNSSASSCDLRKQNQRCSIDRHKFFNEVKDLNAIHNRLITSYSANAAPKQIIRDCKRSRVEPAVQRYFEWRISNRFLVDSLPSSETGMHCKIVQLWLRYSHVCIYDTVLCTWLDQHHTFLIQYSGRGFRDRVETGASNTCSIIIYLQMLEQIVHFYNNYSVLVSNHLLVYEEVWDCNGVLKQERPKPRK